MSLNPDSLVAVMILVPMLAWAFIWIAGEEVTREFVEGTTILSSLVTAGAVLRLLPIILSGQTPGFMMMEVPLGLIVGFRLTPVGMLLTLIAGVLYVPAAIYAVGYMRRNAEHHDEDHKDEEDHDIPRFLAFYNLAIAFTLGLSAARDLFTFFLCFEGLTVSTFPLVFHKETKAVKVVLSKYVAYTLPAGLCLLLLIVLLRGAGADLVLVPGGFVSELKLNPDTVAALFLLSMLSVGVKAAIFPLWSWLPWAMKAPTPVSALLHAVAVVKSGAYGVIVQVFLVFGADLLIQYGLNTVLADVAVFTIIVASLLALKQTGLKPGLAYSTIVKLACVVLCCATLNEGAWIGMGLLMVGHAFAKSTLFFVAGALHKTYHIDNIWDPESKDDDRDRVSPMRGIGRVDPLMMGAFTVAAAAICSIPGLCLFVSKWFTASAHPFYGAVMVFASLVSGRFFVPFLVEAWAYDPPEGLKKKHTSSLIMGPLLFTAVGSLALGFFPNLPGIQAYDLSVLAASKLPPAKMIVSAGPLVLPSWTPQLIGIIGLLGLIPLMPTVIKVGRRAWHELRHHAGAELPKEKWHIVLFVGLLVAGVLFPLALGKPMYIAWGLFAAVGCFMFLFGSDFLGLFGLQREPGYHENKQLHKAIPMLYAAVGVLILPIMYHNELPTRELAKIPVLVENPKNQVVFSPAFIMLIGATLMTVLPARLRAPLTALIPALAFAYIMHIANVGDYMAVEVAGFKLYPYVVGTVNRAPAMVFSLATAIWGVLSLHKKGRVEQIAGQLYGAAAVWVSFSADYINLYLGWETLALASVMLVFARSRKDSIEAAVRYLYTHLIGGGILFLGLTTLAHTTGSIYISVLDPRTAGIGAWLTLLGVAINAGIPPFGSWLPDTYPKATETGAVLMSGLTTKVACYVLIAMFAGWDVLAVAGPNMAVIYVVYAVLPSGPRQMISLHVPSQVGLIVLVIGIGTMLGIDGATAHMICHVIYKGVLFMTVGIMIYATGVEHFAYYGPNLWQKPKFKRVFRAYMIGGLSISGFPAFSGFISKGMSGAAAMALDGFEFQVVMFMLASVGTFLHTGIKLPLNVFFRQEEPELPKGFEPVERDIPNNMVIAAEIGAGLCVLLGLFPELLYQFLPFGGKWDPFTASHFAKTVPFLIGTALMAWYLGPMLWVRKVTVLTEFDTVVRHLSPTIWKVFVDLPHWIADKAMEGATWVTLWMIDQFVKGRVWNHTTPEEPDFNDDAQRQGLGSTLVSLLGLVVVLSALAVLVVR